MTRLDYEIFDLTGSEEIDATTFGFRWLVGDDRTITYSTSGGVVEGADKPGFAGQLGLLFDTFAEFADLRFDNIGHFETFAEAVDAGSVLSISEPVSDDGAIGVQSFLGIPINVSFGLAYIPDIPGLEDQAGLVRIFDEAEKWYGKLYDYAAPSGGPAFFDVGGPGFSLLLHEVGHALGLKHPHDGGIAEGFPTSPYTLRPSFEDLGVKNLDFAIYSIMSYNDKVDVEGGERWPLLEPDASGDILAPTTPMLLDVIALQYLYGPNEETGAGDTVYTLSATGEIRTIWDASGSDLIDQGKSDQGWVIALPDFTVSDLVDTRFGLGLTRAEAGLATPKTLFWLTGEIENVTGSRFRDTLDGNHLNNIVKGGGGKDILFGAAGADVLEGGRGGDQIDGGRGADRIDGGKGNDLLGGGKGLDVFVFEGRFGRDVIVDFNAKSGGEDIDLSGVDRIENWKDLQANHLVETADGVEIKAAKNLVTLLDISIDDLSKNDFLF